MKSDAELEQLVAQLSPTIEPQTDLWPALQARIQQTEQWQALPEPRRATRMPWFAMAASVVFMVWLTPRFFIESSSLAEADTYSEFSPISVAAQLANQRNKTFNAIGSKQLKLVQRIPEGFQNYQQQLAIWQQASAQLEAAIELQPDNRRLQRQYQQLQQQQLSYLSRMAELSHLIS